jgi:hypothetical protein
MRQIAAGTAATVGVGAAKVAERARSEGYTSGNSAGYASATAAGYTSGHSEATARATPTATWRATNRPRRARPARTIPM